MDSQSQAILQTSPPKQNPILNKALISSQPMCSYQISPNIPSTFSQKTQTINMNNPFPAQNYKRSAIQEFTIDEMMSNASKGIFPKSCYFIDNVHKEFSSRYNFFHCNRIIPQ